MDVEAKRQLVEPGQGQISITRQCELLGLPKSSLYYQPVQTSDYNLQLMRIIDEMYTVTPFYGSPRMTACLRRRGFAVNPKRVVRLMQVMGLQAIYPRARAKPAPGHRIYPYLLRHVPVVRINQVWSTDITYIRLRRGWLYLTAVIDWFSRYVLTWEVSNTLEGTFCIEALERALRAGKPEIFNTDQGSHFTSPRFTAPLLAAGVSISMDGRGRALDNIFVERLWRTVKQEEVYLNDYETPSEAICRLGRYLHFYNNERPHQALGYKTPQEVYLAA